MKFAEHLLAHITPEWRRQYIVYGDMKTMLYEAVENIPAIESVSPDEISRLVTDFDEDFLTICEKELFKINVFYEEKLAEAKRKFDALRKEMDALALENQQGFERRQSFFLSPIGKFVGSFGALETGGGSASASSTNTADLKLRAPRPSLLSKRTLSQTSQVHSLTTTLAPTSSAESQTEAATSSLSLASPQQSQPKSCKLSRQPSVASSTNSKSPARTCSNQSAKSSNSTPKQQEDGADDAAEAPAADGLTDELPSRETLAVTFKKRPTFITYGTINTNPAGPTMTTSTALTTTTTPPLAISANISATSALQPSPTSRNYYYHHNSHLYSANQKTYPFSVMVDGGQALQSAFGNLGLASLPNIDKRKLNDIKLAFSEFYLSLVLLQNYQRLNFTGFRKILKKHDKLIGNENGKRWHQSHVERSFFHTNKDVDKLIEETENIVTYHLESGDRQKAMKKLRVPPLNDAPQPWTTFRVGLYLGAFVILLIAVTLTAIFQQTNDDWRIVFRLYRSSLFVILFIFLVGINIYGWRAHGVNHVLIFELDPRDHLGCQDLLEIAFSFGVLWCVMVLLFLWSGPLGIPPLINPVILNTALFLYLFNPTKTFHYTARSWLICCIARTITTPFHRVRFSDFWLADQLNSLVPVLLDIEYTSCFYLSSTDLYGNVDLDRCLVREPKDLFIRMIVACLPAWWRFAQCVRRYFDEGRRANPHLLNAGKYSTVWFVVFFSTLTEYNQDNYSSQLENPFFICWILSLMLSTAYLFTWDVKMDWGLLDAKAPREYRFLREELVYPVKYYYLSIVQDLVFRFGWALNLSLTEVGAMSQDLITLFLAPCEIFRRFIWNFYRLENEHLNNCGEFRAVRDISISGQNIDMSALNRVIKIMDEPDGLATFRSKANQNNKQNGGGGSKLPNSASLASSSSSSSSASSSSLNRQRKRSMTRGGSSRRGGGDQRPNQTQNNKNDDEPVVLII